MTSIFESLWNFSPQLVSVIVIIAILVFISVKATVFFNEFKQMGLRVTNLEVRMDRLEKKVDLIMEFLINKFGK
jgi:hypothetical protein